MFNDSIKYCCGEVEAVRQIQDIKTIVTAVVDHEAGMRRVVDVEERRMKWSIPGPTRS